jgi:hypothetical protein
MKTNALIRKNKWHVLTAISLSVTLLNGDIFALCSSCEVIPSLQNEQGALTSEQNQAEYFAEISSDNGFEETAEQYEEQAEQIGNQIANINSMIESASACCTCSEPMEGFVPEDLEPDPAFDEVIDSAMPSESDPNICTNPNGNE